MTIASIAKQLNENPAVLQKQSLKLYIRQQLLSVEQEIFDLASKYGIKSVAEFERFAKAGKIKEEAGFEDFFRLDHLTAKRNKLKRLLQQV